MAPAPPHWVSHRCHGVLQEGTGWGRVALEWQRGRGRRTRDRPGFQLQTPGAAREGVRPWPALGKTGGWTLFRVLEHSVPRDGCPPGGGMVGRGRVDF